MISISRDSSFKFTFSSILPKDDPITDKPMYFNPEVEDEVITEVLSHKSYRPLLKSSNKVWRDKKN